MSDDALSALDVLLRTPDPADLVGRGHHLTQKPLPALRERTLKRAIDAHLAERRGWTAVVVRDAMTVRHLRVVAR